MTEQWSEENIAARRAVNLQKAREALKLKRASQQPFIVTPVLAEEETPTVEEAKSVTVEKETNYVILAKEKLSELGYTIFYSIASIAVAAAAPVMVGMLRDTILYYRNGITHSDIDRDAEYNNKRVHDVQPSSGHIIFRKV